NTYAKCGVGVDDHNRRPLHQEVSSHYDYAAGSYAGHQNRKNLRDNENAHFAFNNWVKTSLVLIATEFVAKRRCSEEGHFWREVDVLEDEETIEDNNEGLLGVVHDQADDQLERAVELVMAQNKKRRKTVSNDHNYIPSSARAHAVKATQWKTRPVFILDLACGRGGDLNKWIASAQYFQDQDSSDEVPSSVPRPPPLRFIYIGLDNSPGSVKAARDRWQETRGRDTFLHGHTF
ncbi:unnamed protein product, partial [Amoebophrya sp. A25]